MAPETRRRKRMLSSDDAVSTENPNTAIIKKRGRATNKTPNKTIAKDSDQEDEVMDDSEIGQDFGSSKEHKRSGTKRRMPDVEMNGSEDQTYLSRAVKEPLKKVRKLPVSEDGGCSDDSDAMDVHEEEEIRDEDVVPERRSLFRAGDEKERDPCVKHPPAKIPESRIPIKMPTDEPEINLHNRCNYTKARTDYIQRPVACSPGTGVQSQEKYSPAVVVNPCQKPHRDVTLGNTKGQWNANSLPHLAVSYSPRNQGNRITFKNPNIDERTEGWWKTLLSTSILVLLCFLVVCLLLVGDNTDIAVPHDKNMTNGFEAQFMRLESQFPSQRAELWKKSKILLIRNLKTNQRKEPLSIILTSGLRAKKTLHCLAVLIATALSSTLNVTVVRIDGAGLASLDSNQVKLDIDKKLMDTFTDDKGVAVIQQFEELPPGSTLIFYKYCDHENAVFKNTFFIFTILLPVEELDPELSLKEVEEAVQDHIEGRFLSRGQPASFDTIDADKFGGLWSRISHLILPVVPEADTEQNGCRI
ncbi:torsin-1A-interacting protein 1-like isoform X3 [Brienomyrus brachyistius]|uniref:torsin-1A-interacting protein 1-like isoform X3 n=1 Tax=Brienomyrus brachyistius TaxID=42636 RepID=UPI0020B45CE8|nr:torsin-1A-interacting protein 1-like isoform X3 [Brienomyrus brachyistius]